VARATTNTTKLLQDTQNSKASHDFAQLYLIPMLLLIFGVILVFIVLMPQVDTMAQKFTVLQTEQQDYDALLAKKNSRLELLSLTTTQQATLTKINAIIPQSQTDVVGFTERIRAMVSENNLTLSDIKSGEQVTVKTAVNTAGTTSDANLELVEVPAEFQIEGELQNIRKFLGTLYGGQEFIVIKKMELSKKVDDVDVNFSTLQTTQWSINLTLTKFQFRIGKNGTAAALQKSYFNVDETSRANKEIVDFINENYSGISAQP